jgi:hypothetical protein
MQRYDLELRRGDDTIACCSSVEVPDPGAIWPTVAGLAKGVSAPEGRIRVTDQSGTMVISIGIAAARLLRSTWRRLKRRACSAPARMSRLGLR